MKYLILLLFIFIACKSEPSKDMVKFRLWAKQMDSSQKALMNRIDLSIKSLDSLAKQIKKENDSIREGGYLFDTTINKKQWLIDIPLLIDTGRVVEIWRRKLPDSPKYSTPI